MASRSVNEDHERSVWISARFQVGLVACNLDLHRDTPARSNKPILAAQLAAGVFAGNRPYITGIEKSAPARMPVGQRDVTVFRRV